MGFGAEDVGSKEKTKTEQSGLGTWMFSLIDLIILAAIAKCGMITKMCSLSLHTVMFVTTIITVLYVTRLQINDYCNRFYTNDVFHRILYFAYMLCFFIMALNLDVTYTGDYVPNDYICQSNLYGYGFGSAFTATRAIIFLLQGSAILADTTDVVAKQFAMDMLRCTISAGVAFVQDLIVNSGDEYPPSGRYKIYVSCMVIELSFYAWHHIALYYQDNLCSWTIEIEGVYWQIGEYLVGREACPIDVDEYSDRMSAFIMVILGQMVALVSMVYYSETSEGQYDDFAMISMLLVFSYGVLYFDCAEPEALSPPGEESMGEMDKKKKNKKQKMIANKVERWKSNNIYDEGHAEMTVTEEKEAVTLGSTSSERNTEENIIDSPVVENEHNNASIDSRDCENNGGEKQNSTSTVAKPDAGKSDDSGAMTGLNPAKLEGEELGSVVTGRSLKSTKSNRSVASYGSSVSNASSHADTLPEREEGDSLEDEHALNHSLLSSYLFTWLHLVLSLSMFFAITAVTIVYYDDFVKTKAIPQQIDIPQEFSNGDHEPMMSPDFLLAFSIFISLISLTLIRLLTHGLEQLWHPKSDGGHSIRVNTGIKVFLAIIHLFIPLMNIKSGAGICVFHGFLLIISVLSQIRFEADAAVDPTREEDNQKARNTIELLRNNAVMGPNKVDQMTAIDGAPIMMDNPLHSASFKDKSPSNSPSRIAGMEGVRETRSLTRDKIALLAQRKKMGLKTGTRSVPAGSANVAPLGLGLPPPPTP